MSVTVITATLPGRAKLFANLAESIARQTLPPARWLIEWDWTERGPVQTLNKLAAQVETDWLFRIDDDDTLEHDHFELLAEYLTDDYDVVYSWPRVEGDIGHPTMAQKPFDAEQIRSEPGRLLSVAFIRMDLWRKLGGYHDIRHEDWDFWRRALDVGARFRCVPLVTWTYRLGEWEHRSQ